MTKLTRVEEEDLRLRAHGMTSREIAAMRLRSEQTVKNNVKSAYKKLGVRNIVQAMHAKGWAKVP